MSPTFVAWRPFCEDIASGPTADDDAMRSSDDDDEEEEEEEEEEEYEARDGDDDDDDDDDVVVTQRDVKAANIASLVNGTLETCARPYVRGLTVEDPAVTLKRAFKSPFPNAPNRSGAGRAMRCDGDANGMDARETRLNLRVGEETGHPREEGGARRLTMKRARRTIAICANSGIGATVGESTGVRAVGVEGERRREGVAEADAVRGDGGGDRVAGRDRGFSALGAGSRG